MKNEINLAIEFATRKFTEAKIENHFLKVYDILKNDFFVDDECILIAGLLHDVLEDTDTTEAEISKEFSPVVLNLILEVSHPKDWIDKNQPQKNKQELKNEYYEKIRHVSDKAKLIKIADFTDHLKDFIEIYKNNAQCNYPKFINNDLYIKQIREFLNYCNESEYKNHLRQLTNELESLL